jgi:hypothetical protein
MCSDPSEGDVSQACAAAVTRVPRLNLLHLHVLPLQRKNKQLTVNKKDRSMKPSTLLYLGFAAEYLLLLAHCADESAWKSRVIYQVRTASFEHTRCITPHSRF